MNDPATPTFIPAEALARRARLAESLAWMETRGANLEPAPLQALREALREASPDPSSVIAAAVAEGLAEEALELARTARRQGGGPARIGTFTAGLEPHAAKAMARREEGWQLDARRARVRLAFAKEGAALDFDDGDLHAIFLQAFRLEGIRLALDLGKRPRPLLRVEWPLPPGVGGLEEGLEAVLRAEPQDPPAAVLERLNARLPLGIRLHRWDILPSYASPLVELAEAFHWQWPCPPERLPGARARTEAFLAAPAWIWEKGGRVDGRKQVKPLDLRPLVSALRWEGGLLRSTTRAEGTANPLRVHAAILGLDPADLTGLVRVCAELRPDPKLAQAERFEPKLKNIYEDAVLLGGGSNITLVDDEDDEPLRLG